MKEHIDTAPVIEAFESEDECPFCWLERQAEQRAIRYVVGPGASYMEPDVREATDQKGFCRHHLKKMYDYGNSLGNALILQTYYVGMLRSLDRQLEALSVPKKTRHFLFGKTRQTEEADPMLQWALSRNRQCFLCDKMQYNMHRYYITFFFLLKDAVFRDKVASCKGLCMHHFAELLNAAQEHLPTAWQDWFYQTIPSVVRDNFARVQADLDWFIQKFDYRNASADWKNSKDAVSRCMQKLRGAYPADPPYKEK